MLRLDRPGQARPVSVGSDCPRDLVWSLINHNESPLSLSELGSREMTGRRLMLTLLHPLPADVSMSKNSLAKKLSKSSSVFESGVIFKGAENSGGNALGALYPIIHLTPHTGEARRLANTINTSSGPLAISQAVYTELDTVDIAGERSGSRYDTNSIILVGCKVVFTLS